MTYVITYSNHFKISDTIFAFRKKELFEISKIPIYKKQIEVSGCKGYWLKGKFYSLSKLKELIVNEPIDVDVSDLQWYQQEQLNHVFNLR
jgi:hypothetical protein